MLTLLKQQLAMYVTFLGLFFLCGGVFFLFQWTNVDNIQFSHNCVLEHSSRLTSTAVTIAFSMCCTQIKLSKVSFILNIKYLFSRSKSCKNACIIHLWLLGEEEKNCIQPQDFSFFMPNVK